MLRHQYTTSFQALQVQLPLLRALLASLLGLFEGIPRGRHFELFVVQQVFNRQSLDAWIVLTLPLGMVAPAVIA